jgi:hypothetical protein
MDMRTLDVETKQGLENFRWLSDWQRTWKELRGSEAIPTRRLVSACWVQLVTTRTVSDDDGEMRPQDVTYWEVFIYPDCVQDAELFYKYEQRYRDAEKQSGEMRERIFKLIDADVLADEELIVPINSLAQRRSEAALALNRRRNSIWKSHDPDAFPKLIAILVPRLMGTGNHDAARILERLAMYPELGEVFKDEPIGRPINPETLKPKKLGNINGQDRAAARLAKYEVATQGKTGHELREVEDALCAADRKDNNRKKYMKTIKEARETRDKKVAEQNSWLDDNNRKKDIKTIKEARDTRDKQVAETNSWLSARY